MKTLKESLLNSTDKTLQAGDEHFGINTFPSKKDFKRHNMLKGYRCTWIFPAFKDIYEKELKTYLGSSTLTSWILPKYNEITGISAHVQKVEDKVYRIDVYLEGINRGNFTEIGLIIPHLFGERDTMNKAKDAAYEFLCKIKDNEQFFKEALKYGENKLKWTI